MTADPLTCSECSEPVGLLRITRDLLMLGHRREPKTLHAVRLSKPAHEVRTSVSGPATVAPVARGRTREPNDVPVPTGARPHRDEARSEPGLSDLASAVPGATLREHIVTSRGRST